VLRLPVTVFDDRNLNVTPLSAVLLFSISLISVSGNFNLSVAAATDAK
jgi:hypothetical protein